MTQYINLYSADLRPGRDLLTLGNVVVAMGGALLLVIGLALFGMSRTSNEQRSFKAVEARLHEMQAQVALFAVQQGQRQQDPALQARLAESEARLNNRRAILERLKNGSFGGRNGFSGVFTGLAEISVEGVWLTSIELRSGGREMALRGRLLNEALLPRYVDALSGHSGFSGRQFRALEVRGALEEKSIEVTPSRPQYLEFSLSGLSAEAEKTAVGAQ